MFHMYGQETWRRHDLILYRQSDIANILNNPFMMEGRNITFMVIPLICYDRGFK